MSLDLRFELKLKILKERLQRYLKKSRSGCDDGEGVGEGSPCCLSCVSDVATKGAEWKLADRSNK